MTTLVYALLTLACLGLSAWLWPRREGLHVAARGAVVASLVGLLLTAVSAGMIVFHQLGWSNDAAAHGQRILGLAAQHMALPLVGLATLFLARGLTWGPSLWSKVILGIMGFYELSRHMGLQLEYLWLVNLVGALALLASAVLYLPRDRRLVALAALAPAFLLAPALFAGRAPLDALFIANDHASWLIPGLVGAGLAVGLLTEQAHNALDAREPQEPEESP
ncbi:hypothetical protein [Pseudomonas sp.]|uniref:hypothetical protein n=1 Tax=Pseudomonas sp. TaxID=306 RepID=UPI0027297EA3|nr:hypothetical protein [Pseudomonas sp.]